jgi:hypothetical protein
MDLDQHPTSAIPPSRPFRFGITDMIAAVILFGIQLAILRTCLREIVHFEDTQRLIAAAFIVAAFTFGAAYLCARLLTERKCANVLVRIGVLLAVDVGLLVGTAAIICLFPVFIYVGVSMLTNTDMHPSYKDCWRRKDV